MAFFDLAPQFGLSVRRLATIEVGRQFEDEGDEEVQEEEERAEVRSDMEEDITAQVQLWEIVRSPEAERDAR